MGWQSFGVWLEQQIYDRSMQKIDLAKLLHVSPSVITQWTTGETKPARRRVAALACALGVSPYEIYLRMGDIEPRGELNAEWDLFLHQVEADGAEFKQAILEALEDLRRTWMARPRRVRSVLRISFIPFEYVDEGPERGGEIGEMSYHEKLLYFDEMTFEDGFKGEVMITAVPHLGKEAIDLIATASDNTSTGVELERGELVIGDKIYYAEIRANEARFPDLLITLPIEDFMIALERKRDK
jgi:transcriptional regulator with XRE-family HTH domain